MAKEDFCFTFYDGDATRDMSHMNRLERGCYTDIIISIRKFGHLSLDQIKKVLSKDFDECFSAIELVLLKDDEGKFFIEWLEKSLQKSKKHSKIQRNNRVGKTKQEPINNQNTQSVPPLGDGYGYGYEDVNENEEIGGAGENELNFIVPKMQKLWIENFPNYTQNKKFDYESLGAILGFMFSQSGNHDPTDKNTQEMALNTLQAIADEVKKEIFWVNKPLKSISNNIQEFYNKIKNPQNAGRCKKDKPTADSLQQALNRRFQQQDGSDVEISADAYKRTG